MTAVILMLRGNRFTKSNQDFLKSLNDWTFGKIWQNLIILNGRQPFRVEDLKDRLETQSQRYFKPERVVNLTKLDGNRIYQGLNMLHTFFNIKAIYNLVFLEDLFARSKYDKKYSEPWEITDAIPRRGGTYAFQRREINREDFRNIKSSLLNGQQVKITLIKFQNSLDNVKKLI